MSMKRALSSHRYNIFGSRKRGKMIKMMKLKKQKKQKNGFFTLPFIARWYRKQTKVDRTEEESGQSCNFTTMVRAVSAYHH